MCFDAGFKKDPTPMTGQRIVIFLSTFLWNCFLCQDRWNGDVMPILDGALLCSSWAGSDLGRESRLV